MDLSLPCPMEAISMKVPTLRDMWLSDELHILIESENIFECERVRKHRIKVLGKLERLARQWIKEVAIIKNIPAETAEPLGGNLYTFGLYRFGALDQDDYIDAICVAPKIIDPMDFIRSFYAVLREHKDVTQCVVIKKAGASIIKMIYFGVKIDLQFVSLSLKAISKDLKFNDDCLPKNIDHRTLHRLNGCRITEAILSKVPNKQSFGIALRAIILWAKRRRIYTYTIGYFDGMDWALLMARTCLFYPTALASVLVKKCFLVALTFQWPASIHLNILNDGMGFTAWNPSANMAHQLHLMPFTAPAYTGENSTANLTPRACKIILDEITIAYEVAVQIGKDESTWNNLLKDSPFFNQYEHFIVLLAHADTEEDSLAWVALLELHLHLLAEDFESNLYVEHAHLNVKKFTYKKGETFPACAMWFIGLSIKQELYELDLTSSVYNFTVSVVATAMKIGLFKTGMNFDTRHVKAEHLSDYLNIEVLARERVANAFSKAKRRWIGVDISEEEAACRNHAKRFRSSTPIREFKANVNGNEVKR